MSEAMTPEFKTKLRKLGFHDGRKRIIKRPDVKRRPIDHTSKVFNYRGECVPAYYKAIELEGYEDVARYLLEEWRWAYELIVEGGFT